MKIYIKNPQTVCIYPVKWCLEIASRLGGVRGQRNPPENVWRTDRPTDRRTNGPTDRRTDMLKIDVTHVKGV